MSHRLGSVLPTTPVVIGPDAGAPTDPPDTWTHVFPVDPAAKFVMLHLNGAALGAGDHVEIELGYDTDVYDASWGPDFWSRPVRGDLPVTIRYVRVGAGAGSVTLDQYGRGEALVGSGSTNANGDVFLLDPSFDDPTHQNPLGKFPPGTEPSWQNVAELPDGVMKDTARRVGMYIVVDGDHLSSCTATLIDADLVVTAGHCVATDDDARTGAITFDFQTDALGNRPAGYDPKFHKLVRVVRSGYDRGPGDDRPLLDYSVIQIQTPTTGLGLAPVPVRSDVPPMGEPLFIIHHPRGAVKKVSSHPLDPSCSVGAGSNEDQIFFECDIDNGSSGSSIFDSSGRIVANLSWWDWGISILAMSQDLITEPPPERDVDVVLVFDRSGSMSLPALDGGSDKITEARRAAALFVSLLLEGAGHRVGLVSFSTSPALEKALSNVDSGTKEELIGPSPPGEAGKVGDLTSGGMTTIGGGLQHALGLFPAPSPTSNSRAVLLLTDGLENTPPMIATVEPALSGTRLNVIGFGTDASLDGPGLTRLARDHRGLYTRAGEGLTLKKFFALAFGRIFDFGTSLDPDDVLPENVAAAAPISISVCGEIRLTAVLGWDNAEAILLLELETPTGSRVTSATPGVTAGAGNTWAHLSIPLPFGGEGDGIWKVHVRRPPSTGEIPPPAPEMHFFVTTMVEGGPHLRALELPPTYTGDTVNPRVALLQPGGGHPPSATVTVTIDAPTEGTGNLLTSSGLGAPGVVDGDVLDPRSNTLIQMELAKGTELVPTSETSVTLYDDGEHEDGGLEPDGVFGNPLSELTRFEGHYRFHARARYGTECVAHRETSWSIYVAVGIDPAHTAVTTEPPATLPDGRERVRLTFTPRDRYGNFLGPGRVGSFATESSPGNEPQGVPIDQGDGSYVQVVTWNPGSGEPPGVTVRQPGRPPVVLTDPSRRVFSYCVKFLYGRQPECGCGGAPVRPGTYATDVNIYNPHDAEIRIRKHVVPLVMAGATLGREPRTVSSRATETLELPPHSATMDDCVRLTELLFGDSPASTVPLTIGILEIVSLVQLDVTAVYTVSSLEDGSVDIDTENIKPRLVS
jgi:hypothetical protein